MLRESILVRSIVLGLSALNVGCGTVEPTPDYRTSQGVEIFVEPGASPNLNQVEAAINGSISGVVYVFGAYSDDTPSLYRLRLKNSVAITAFPGNTIDCGSSAMVVGCTSGYGHHVWYATDPWECPETIVAHELAHVVGFMLGDPDNDHNNPSLFGPGSVQQFGHTAVAEVCNANSQ